MIHRVGITHFDADGLSQNPSLLDEDFMGIKWHGNCNQEAIPIWHELPTSHCFFDYVLIHGSNN